MSSKHLGPSQAIPVSMAVHGVQIKGSSYSKGFYKSLLGQGLLLEGTPSQDTRRTGPTDVGAWDRAGTSIAEST